MSLFIYSGVECVPRFKRAPLLLLCSPSKFLSLFRAGGRHKPVAITQVVVLVCLCVCVHEIVDASVCGRMLRLSVYLD